MPYSCPFLYPVCTPLKGRNARLFCSAAPQVFYFSAGWIYLLLSYEQSRLVRDILDVHSCLSGIIYRLVLPFPACFAISL